jgi:hypothetical protein
MELRPLHDNVWGVPLMVLNDRWQDSNLIRPEMARREKIFHTIRVVATGPSCKDIEPGDIAILPEDHGGAIITIRLDNGQTQRRFCFSESRALATWTGAIPGNEDTMLITPRLY